VHTDTLQPWPGVERRQSPRYSVPETAEAHLAAATSVRVLDISLGGVLLLSMRPASAGDRGRLSITMGDSPIATDIEIGRVAEIPNQPGYRLGARFTNLIPEHRAAIARFIGE
jgi:hypothetical protein